MTLLSTLEAERVVAIVRRADASASELVDIATALVGAGVTVIEFPLTNRSALEAIRAVASARLTAFVGAGTVLTVDDALRVRDAGGAFIVTPNLDPAVLEVAHEAGLAALPGAFTATEIALARSLGAEAVKVFPSGPVGPTYISALLGPYPDALLIPTGGISVQNACQYIAAGALAVGLGSDLIGDGSPGNISQRVHALRRTLTLEGNP